MDRVFRPSAIRTVKFSLTTVFLNQLISPQHKHRDRSFILILNLAIIFISSRTEVSNVATTKLSTAVSLIGLCLIAIKIRIRHLVGGIAPSDRGLRVDG